MDVGDPVSPRWFASDGQSLWVHEPVGLVRVDIATSAITGQFPMYMEYGYATTGAGALWQTDYAHDNLLRIDPVTDKLVASIPVGLQPLGVAVTSGAVWVADEHSEAVTRVDPKTNAVVATIPIGQPGAAGPQIMTAGPKGVWVDVPNMGEVVRIDAATNSVGLRVPLDGAVASDGKEVWIGVLAGPHGLPQVDRIDPDSGDVIASVDLVVPSIDYLAVGLGSVWVIAGGWGGNPESLFRIDSATGRIVGRIDLDAGGNDMVAGGAVWVTADSQPYVLQISPQ